MNNIKLTSAKNNSISIIGFTDDQRKAYDSLMSFINTEYTINDAKRALIGPAGTGKTYLVKALIKNCNYAYSQIGLAAPTHKACRVLNESINLSNIKVNTLQSDLGLRLNFDIEKFDIDNLPFDPKGRVKIGDYKVYIVDEASMINKSLLTFLENKCKEYKCKLILIGDASQLAPVNELYSSAFKGIKSDSLNQIVRQEDDNSVKELLNILRYDIKNKSFNFIKHIMKHKTVFDNNNIKGYKVCNTLTEFNDILISNFNDPQLTQNVDFVKVIGYTNIAISGWNKYIRNNIILDADKNVLTKHDLLISYVTIVNQFNEIVLANSEEYIINDIVNYTHPTYQLKGFLCKFTAIHGGKITNPLFVLDHKDLFTITKYVQISNSMIDAAKYAPSRNKAQKWREYFAFKEECLLLTNISDKNGKIMYSRDLDYGFALTAHKSQGSTFDTVFVDVDDIIYNKYNQIYSNVEEINRRLYVACSRCKNKLYLKFTK